MSLAGMQSGNSAEHQSTHSCDCRACACTRFEVWFQWHYETGDQGRPKTPFDL